MLIKKQKPYAFSFWESSSLAPAYILLCQQSQNSILPENFELVRLNFETCLDWLPDRDEIYRLTEPATSGRSVTQENRRWAIFSDILRVLLLEKHGGIWVDADTVVFPGFGLLANLIPDMDLIASEEEGMRVANSIMGARKNSSLMKKFATEIRGILNATNNEISAKAGFGEFGSWILKRLLAKHVEENVYIAPFGMLLTFDTTTLKSQFAPSEQFDRYIPPTALAMSLFNNSISLERRAMSKEQLLNEDSVFSHAWHLAMNGTPEKIKKTFVLSQSSQLHALNRYRIVQNVLRKIDKQNRNMVEQQRKLKERNNRIVQLREAARKLAVNNTPDVDLKAHHTGIFTEIYNEGLWDQGGSRSGCGSSLRQTLTLRELLPDFLKKHQVTRLLDAPCGDFNWMRHVDLKGINYIGGDIVAEVIASNAIYADGRHEFIVLDVVNDDLPAADCIMCRDCYSHLPNEQVLQSLSNVVQSGIKYLLVTHYSDLTENKNISVGDFRQLNFQLAPFNFPPPKDILYENHPNPKHRDKALALWKCQEIAMALAIR